MASGGYESAEKGKSQCDFDSSCSFHARIEEAGHIKQLEVDLITLMVLDAAGYTCKIGKETLEVSNESRKVMAWKA